MLLFKNFNDVKLIRTYGMIPKWYYFVVQLYYVCSFKLITHNKSFNARVIICQHKTECYIHTLILLKPSSLHVHLRRDPMVF